MNGAFFDFYWPYKYGNSEDGYLTDGYRVVQMNGTGVWSSYGVTLDFAKGNKWNLIQTGKDQSHEIASFDIYNEFLVEITTNVLTYNFHLLPESFRDGGKNFMQGHYISDNHHGYCYISATKVILSSERYVVKCEDISFNGNKITDYTVNIFAR